ncbi:MAG: hypothetical protein GIX03_13095, partial [Candidatus Eremiobacteraeota bacterium]|nr:hypothetical protein [Candidatus Eremiobacteraeota bacterium]
GTAERFDVIQFTPFAIAYDFGLGPRGASAVSISLALAALLIAAWTIRERRRTDVESVALAAAAFPLVCPFLHAHDLSVTLLPGLLCVVRARGAAWLAAACGLLLVGGGWFGFSQGLDGLGFTLGLFLVAVFAVIALAGPAVGLVRLAPLGLVPLALAYGWFAIAHPITFWPAALPSGFAVPGHPEASVVWEIEQRVNGLERPDAWWASLRAVSLAGSAMLFGAMVALLRPERALERRPRMLAWLLVEG